MWQQYTLGGFFRRRYSSYLNSVYCKHQIRVESADVDCRLMSAQCHLAGLYPAVSLRIPLQPVPIHSLPADQKHMLEFDEPCRRFDMLFHEATNSREARALAKSNKEFMSKVAEEAGWPESNLKNIWKTYEALYCTRAHNISLPKWVNDTVFERLRSLTAAQYKFLAFTAEMQRLKAGPFLNVMLQRMQQAQKVKKVYEAHDETMKFYIYSSQSAMLTQVMSALGVWNNLTPSYATALVFELEERQPDDFIVRVLYKNGSASNAKVGQQLHLLHIPGCSVDCPLKTFEKLVKPMLMTGDWHTECACVPHFRVRKVALTLIVFTLTLGIATVLYILHKRHQSAQEVQYERSFDNYGSSATDIL
ncbi:hypothetical protein NP493_1217g00011 [Ridgeia piscesae]|uniref:acid phosphatase n=1 Tax=Ridgeia piscesae TaxID=27915 RepID=A0AAD9KC41_RIDPI|nr:hypothetical protein NP493_1217g00011 [Ridgeia piscesae]